MELWPSTLPCPQKNAVSYAPKFENILTSQMEGRVKRRRRFTHVPDVMTFSLKLTSAQMNTLEEFVQLTLKDVDAFEWKEWRAELPQTAVYRFVKRPTYTNIGLHFWQADIELDVMTRFIDASFVLDVMGNGEAYSG